MRAGGVAAAAGQLDLDGVRGGGDGTYPGADLSHLDPGVAVQRQDPGILLEDALLDAALGAAGHGFLGRLEDDPHGTAQRRLLVHPLQDQGRAEHGRGVDIVAAGVGDAVVLRGERQPGFLDDGQGVDVAAQGGGDRAVPDINRQARPFEAPGFEAGFLESLDELVRGAEFLEGELRVCVQVPPEGDQLRQERLEPRPHQCGGLSFSRVVAHRITLASGQ